MTHAASLALLCALWLALLRLGAGAWLFFVRSSCRALSGRTDDAVHDAASPACITHVPCTACLQDPRCGWCAAGPGGGSCTEGSWNGPAVASSPCVGGGGALPWFWVRCPGAWLWRAGFVARQLLRTVQWLRARLLQRAMRVWASPNAGGAPIRTSVCKAVWCRPTTPCAARGSLARAPAWRPA